MKELVLVLLCVVLGSAWRVEADEPSTKTTGANAAGGDVNRRLLSEFGPYKEPSEAYATLDKALRSLVRDGGGVLVIPHDAPETFYPRSRVQAAYGKPGVTVVDTRGGVERFYVPPLGAGASDGVLGGSRLIERDAAGNFPWQGTYSTEAVVSRFRGGPARTWIASPGP